MDNAAAVQFPSIIHEVCPKISTDMEYLGLRTWLVGWFGGLLSFSDFFKMCRFEFLTIRQ